MESRMGSPSCPIPRRIPPSPSSANRRIHICGWLPGHPPAKETAQLLSGGTSGAEKIVDEWSAFQQGGDDFLPEDLDAQSF